MGVKVRPLEDRFWEKVDKNGPEHPTLGTCWIWKGDLAGAGYGWIGAPPGHVPKSLRAHRVAWELFVGPIPEGLYVLHECDNRACVRPAHLIVGTQKENMRQMDERGRRVTVAPKGEDHPKAKLSAVQVRAIRADYDSGTRQVDLAKEFGVSQVQISHIVQGLHWRSLLADSALDDSDPVQP